MNFQVICPFCRSDVEVPQSAEPYVDADCLRCGARFRCEAFNETLHAVTTLPSEGSRKRIGAVLEAGIHGKGVGISAEEITREEIRSYGVQLGYPSD
ncbi:hypothetical protein ACFQE1_16080 [Halobium palmae]|uniref:Uncharacterized protein n=1 Tax=Halobium palmae TaxID=1776492 RepID=A0ABD5S2L4_9EURY